MLYTTGFPNYRFALIGLAVAPRSLEKSRHERPQAIDAPKRQPFGSSRTRPCPFEQIAEFCGLHVLEVKGIADGDVAQGIKGLDPVTSNQLSRDEIERAEKDAGRSLKISEPKVILPEHVQKRGPRYTPVSRRHDRPNAVLWLIRNHPELKTSQIMRLVGTTKPTHCSDPRSHPLEFARTSCPRTR